MNTRYNPRSVLTNASIALALCSSLSAQLGPEVTSWRTNLNGAKGSSINPTINAVVSGVSADVQSVQYNTTDVYVRCTTVPSHNVGPFPGNPNTPGNTNSIFRITRSPRKATRNTRTGLGPIGVFVNGVPAFNALDGRSYFNQGTWNQNAYVTEGRTFDAALGHPAPGRGGAGLYHYHNMPLAVLTQEAETWGKGHSPLIGFSFDGFPIYGPYGFVNTNGTGGVRRMRTSYRKRSITVRQKLPNGTPLPSNRYGPVVSARYPLGYFVEDFEYVNTMGDLDQFNGRFTVTPQYPGGIYAYFVTVDASKTPEYPFIVGPQYYGVPINNRGVSIPGGVTTYVEQVQHTGAGCSGLFLDASGLPKVPNSSFAITLADGQANANALFIIGSGLLPTPTTLFGCPIYLNLASPFTTVGLVTLNSSGGYSLALPIPNNSALIGLSVDMQSAAAAGTGTTTSNALTLLLK
jgi:hypothetical protein